MSCSTYRVQFAPSTPSSQLHAFIFPWYTGSRVSVLPDRVSRIWYSSSSKVEQLNSHVCERTKIIFLPHQCFFFDCQH